MRTDSLIRAVEAFARAAQVPGLQVVVATPDETLLRHAHGVADVENDVAVSPTTRFRLASISKSLAAAAVMRLVERDELALDAPIERYFQGFPVAGLTTRQLLAHTAGIRHYRDDDEVVQTRRYAALAESLHLFAADPLAHAPGTGYLYSTFGYTLLGCVAEAASGVSFGELLRREVFLPAGMARAAVDDARQILPGRTRGYCKGPDGGLRNSDFVDNSYKTPGGGLVATATDLAAFARSLFTGSLLSEATVREMWSPQTPRDVDGTFYGLGWILAERNGAREVYHTGGQQQVSTVLYLQPERQLSVAVLANLEESAPLTLARELADLVDLPKA